MEYRIGDFSKISRLSMKTLRYYHEIGILNPSRIDNISGYRYYEEKSLDKANVINELRSLDFSIEEIKDILQNHNEDETIVQYMNSKLSEINRKLKRYKEIQVKISGFIKKQEGIKMTENNDIVLKEVPDMLIASIRYKGKYSDTGKYIGTLFKNCTGFVAGNPFSLYYDVDFKEDDADIELCLPISKEVNKDMVKSRMLKGEKVVSIIHKGSYETIGKSYKAVIDYINENGIKTRLPSREIYIKGPGMIFKGNQENYITEIQIVKD